MTTHRLFKPLILALVLFSAVTGCSREEDETRPEASPVPVQVIVAAHQEELARFEVAGEVVSTHRFEVASRISGRIQELPVTEGSRVRRGDLLVRLDAPELHAALTQARATEEAARLEMEMARRQADRFRRLRDAEVVTQRDLELAETAEAGAVASHERARAMTQMSEENLAYAVVRSPRSAVVVRRLARVGDLAGPGEAVLVLEDTEETEVRVTAPVEWDLALEPGSPAEVRVSVDAAPRAAVVDRIVPGADGNTREIYLTADGLTTPTGAFLRVTLFGSGSGPTLRVPESALIRRGPLTGVFTVRDDRAALRWLRLSPDGRVLAGLSPGDRIVDAPPAGLSDGDRIEVTS
jgi:RND family efflux transporter MFP subunit